MSAEVLRRAASLMRERAEAARDITGASDWHVGGLDHFGDYFVRSSGGRVASQMVEEEAEHVASWHPAVALAVADWLDSEADAYDTCLAKQADPERRFQSLWTATANARHDHALTVARAYLGEAS